jgi:phosphoribosyl-AMP cyclohydrolase
VNTANDEVGRLTFDRDGLVPAVIQDAESRAVLMVGFMNQDALRLTRKTGRTHFWSRSRARLWRKGETSGHEQIVRDVLINCEENTLLITVEQIGAVCHTGFETCFFRRFEADGSLTVIGRQAFDPKVVYGEQPPSLQELTKTWFGAYEYLRDHDFSDVSSTSKRLRTVTESLDSRIADELRELAGVLDGSHRHSDLADDLLLEGSQVLYWITLSAVRDGITWRQLRPDVALDTTEDELPLNSLVRVLRGEADRWSSPADSSERGSRMHATIALVAQACVSSAVSPTSLIEVDLAELRSKQYLDPYFELLAGS